MICIHGTNCAVENLFPLGVMGDRVRLNRLKRRGWPTY